MRAKNLLGIALLLVAAEAVALPDHVFPGCAEFVELEGGLSRSRFFAEVDRELLHRARRWYLIGSPQLRLAMSELRELGVTTEPHRRRHLAISLAVVRLPLPRHRAIVARTGLSPDVVRAQLLGTAEPPSEDSEYRDLVGAVRHLFALGFGHLAASRIDELSLAVEGVELLE